MKIVRGCLWLYSVEINTKRLVARGKGDQISWNRDLITDIRSGSIHSILTPTVPERRRHNIMTPATYCVSGICTAITSNLENLGLNSNLILVLYFFEKIRNLFKGYSI